MDVETGAFGCVIPGGWTFSGTTLPYRFRPCRLHTGGAPSTGPGHDATQSREFAMSEHAPSSATRCRPPEWNPGSAGRALHPSTPARPPRRTLILALLFLVTAAASPGGAQETAPGPEPAPGLTVLAGVGNSLGWLGGSVEKYLAHGRYSLFAGVGYTPEVGNQGPFGPTGAIGSRLYLGGDRWRWFGELSVSQIAVGERAEFVPPDLVEIEEERLYGPGLLGGVQFTGRGGFTLHTGLGVGWFSTSVEGDDWALLLNLGLGYTWF